MSRDAQPLPERVGPYRVLALLGEGGMGVVYEADETGPVRRRVAVKVVRAGVSTREIRSRFEAERQALALMDHAGIAKVLAAGETADGLPYVAMELVRGLPLTTYCDTHRLTTAQRVDLFIQVCHAVQHAHQKGVIHRDLKPSNVLVVEEDGVPRPKIIDFGIAKAVGQPLTDRTLVTHAGVALGTAAYMSPEQAESSGLDVDTRADIYSLGVILYELLVGRLPVEPDTLGYHAFIARLISRETTPPAPSVRVDTLGHDRASIAHARNTNVEHLRRALSGDLDWIVLKALEPDRSRRYATANALALDLQRARNFEPITARPPTAAYRLGRFIRRHRVGAAAAAVVVVGLGASVVLASLGLVRAQQAERRAAAEAAAASQVTEFVVGMFGVSDPDELRGASQVRDVTARELLERGAERAQRQLADQPEQQGRILQRIGAAYLSLGLYEAARTHLAAAIAAQERALAPSDPALADSYLALGQAARNAGDYGVAEEMLARAIEIRSTNYGAASSEVAQALGSLALVRWRQGRLAEAESLYLRVVRIDDATFEPDDPRLARDLMGLGVIYLSQGRYADADPLMRRSLEVRERRLGPDHPDLASVLNNLGVIAYNLRDYRQALAYYRRTHGIYERTIDSLHPNMASVLNNIGEVHWRLGELDRAEPALRQALAIKELRFPPGHTTLATTLFALGGVQRDRGQRAEAERLYRRALDIRANALPAGDAAIAEVATDLAALLRAGGRAAEAQALEGRYLR